MTTRIVEPKNVPFFEGEQKVHRVWESYFRRVAARISQLPSYTVAGVPSAAQAGAGAMIYVTDETDGAVPAFSDGADWRRVTDRAVVS